MTPGLYDCSMAMCYFWCNLFLPISPEPRITKLLIHVHCLMDSFYLYSRLKPYVCPIRLWNQFLGMEVLSYSRVKRKRVFCVLYLKEWPWSLKNWRRYRTRYSRIRSVPPGFWSYFCTSRYKFTRINPRGGNASRRRIPFYVSLQCGTWSLFCGGNGDSVSLSFFMGITGTFCHFN